MQDTIEGKGNISHFGIHLEDAVYNRGKQGRQRMIAVMIIIGGKKRDVGVDEVNIVRDIVDEE